MRMKEFKGEFRRAVEVYTLSFNVSVGVGYILRVPKKFVKNTTKKSKKKKIARVLL